MFAVDACNDAKLYFQLWDRLLGTNHPRYAETFTQNASRAAAAVDSQRSGLQGQAGAARPGSDGEAKA